MAGTVFRAMKRTATSSRGLVPRPFLKWAGGKRALLPELVETVRKAGEFGRYHEPFLGGGALFFELARIGAIGRKYPRLSDGNPNLIHTYESVRDELSKVLSHLREHEGLHSKEHYYRVRALGGAIPNDKAERAARVVYLNKTCFNGLYRENSRGEFNVPIGRYTNPVICDEGNLRAVSHCLRKTKLDAQPFEAILEYAQRGDLVYFDPPYDPVSTTSSFTAYNGINFDESSQRALADVVLELNRKGVKVIVSNSMTPLIKGLYAPTFHVRKVHVNRAINSKASSRGRIEEALISNFP